MKYSYIYIVTNKWNTTFYSGVTDDLVKRTYQHKNKLVEGFSSKYNLDKLVYFEQFENIEEAIKREKVIKGGSRAKKIKLIKSINPNFNDLYDELLKS